jgi:hypothetical protein
MVSPSIRNNGAEPLELGILDPQLVRCAFRNQGVQDARFGATYAPGTHGANVVTSAVYPRERTFRG